MNLDFEYDAKPDFSSIRLSDISTLAYLQAEAEAAVDLLECHLKTAKDRLKRISEDLLPDAMRAAGLSELKLVDGSEVTIKAEVKISIPAANSERAFAWLADNNLEGIIKTEVVTQFTSGEIHRAYALCDSILAADPEASPLIKRNVHPQTLKAWAKERLSSGLEIPEMFSVYPFNKTSISKGNPQTLKAWAKERLSSGLEMPEMFNKTSISKGN